MVAWVFKLICMTIFYAVLIYFAIRILFWVWVTVVGTIFDNIEDQL